MTNIEVSDLMKLEFVASIGRLALILALKLDLCLHPSSLIL
jgi:hypothetical protein